ncbi:hypothetical protein [Georgenia thermotolerans]|uniref:Uncharacterized protein n=1 Tax=Georgenia thermotolerans TaxID=527326 RepID=A0A7J5UJ28_9MICO|nr:hypothetical protein [Georgenia thermotolerans]KAE8762388.1 hypothetical protein GB883_19615 [Georgenia thermotolerans]
MSQEAAGQDPSARACRLLRRLLGGVPAYRSLWQVYVRRASGQDIHQGAIAQVLADYLWETGEVAETETDLPRRLKDRVNRALSGHFIAPATLRLFIEAFDMSPADSHQLWALFMNAESTELAVVRPTASGAEKPLEAAPGAYETLVAHEFHRIGPDGLPADHRTLQVIRALEPMDRYVYQFDVHAAAVEVLRGGRAGPVRRSTMSGLYGVEIRLTTPLLAGETASLEYRTAFTFGEVPPPSFRRGARRRLSSLEINVQFHPARLPERVWWGHWDGIWADEPDDVEEVPLAPDGHVHRFLPQLEGEIVGFTWAWPR